MRWQAAGACVLFIVTRAFDLPLQQLWFSSAQFYSSSVMTQRRFYFQIRSANVCECITAQSLTEAKAIAANTWLPWWNELEWLNPETVTDLTNG